MLASRRRVAETAGLSALRRRLRLLVAGADGVMMEDDGAAAEGQEFRIFTTSSLAA